MIRGGGVEIGETGLSHAVRFLHEKIFHVIEAAIRQAFRWVPVDWLLSMTTYVIPLDLHCPLLGCENDQLRSLPALGDGV